MVFPLTLPDLSLLLAVLAIILLVASELLYALPDYSCRSFVDKKFLRLVAVGCGLGFAVTVVMRFAQMF